jgi:hypothetical protein
MYLSNKERQTLINEFKSQPNWEAKLLDEYKHLPLNEQIEEVIAEEFRDYVLSGGNKISPKKKSFFDRFIDFNFIHGKYIINFNVNICETSNNEIKKYEVLFNNKIIGNIGIEYNGDLIFYINGVIDWEIGIIDSEILNKKELLKLRKLLIKTLKL